MIRLIIICFIYFGLVFKACACEMPDSSIVYFKLFNTQTILPITKKDFQGMKMVIKNKYFKNLLGKTTKKNREEFFEDIRMAVNYDNNIYYINQEGEIELNNSAIGKLDKEAINHLDSGYDLYEWETCRPMNEVLEKMLKEHNKHVEKLFKEQILENKP